MAGVKGKSGGARANAGGARPNSGGARPGAGRPRKKPAPTPARDPLAFLLDVMQGKLDPTEAQLRAGIAAARLVKAEGKKEAAKSAAHEVVVAGGKFAPRVPPKLRAVKPNGE